jgi:hypothetical protein
MLENAKRQNPHVRILALCLGIHWDLSLGSLYQLTPFDSFLVWQRIKKMLRFLNFS